MKRDWWTINSLQAFSYQKIFKSENRYKLWFIKSISSFIHYATDYMSNLPSIRRGISIFYQDFFQRSAS